MQLTKIWDPHNQVFEVPTNKVAGLVKKGWTLSPAKKTETPPVRLALSRKQRRLARTSD